MSDLIFYGGLAGAFMGNQQFTLLPATSRSTTQCKRSTRFGTRVGLLQSISPLLLTDRTGKLPRSDRRMHQAKRVEFW